MKNKNSFLNLVSDVKNGENVESLAEKMSSVKECKQSNCTWLKSALVVLFNGMKNAKDPLYAATVSMHTSKITEKRKMYKFFKRLGLRLKIYSQSNNQTLFLLSNAG